MGLIAGQGVRVEGVLVLDGNEEGKWYGSELSGPMDMSKLGFDEVSW